MRKYALAIMMFMYALITPNLYCAGQNGIVEFKLVCENQEPDCDVMISEDFQKETYLRKQPLIITEDLQSAFVNNTPVKVIVLQFNEDGKKKLEKVTSDNIDKRLGIIIDGKLIMTPMIRQPITTGWMQIKLSKSTEGDAETIALHIKRAIALRHKSP